MKRFILFLLVGALLLLPLSGCFADNNQTAETTPTNTTENTTPEVTIPEVTTPEETIPEVTTPEVTTPEATTLESTTPEVTTPEMTTPEETTVPEETTTPEETTEPEDNPVYYPPNPLVIELFGDEDIEFWVVPIAVRSPLSNWSDYPFTVKDGNIYFFGTDIYNISYCEGVDISFADISEYKWFVDQSEEIMAVVEKIESSEWCYTLESPYDDGSAYWPRFLMFDIDGDYYFVIPSSAGKTVRKFYQFFLD